MVRPQRFDAFWSDAAIGSTIGTAVLFLTAVVSAGAVYASVADIEFDGEATPRIFDVESTAAEHQVRLRAGESLKPGDVQVLVKADGQTNEADLWDYHAPALEDGGWSVDEVVCVIGPGSDCLFSTGYAIQVKITAHEAIIFEGESVLGSEPSPGDGGGYSLLPGESFGDVDDGLVQICHKPGTNAEKTKSIPYAAFHGHTGHGDTVGACSGDADEDNGKLVICHMPGILDLSLTVAYSGWNGHEGHADTVGAC